MNMRERIARAISGAPFPSKRAYAKADAVLAAMAEPTEAMKAAAMVETDKHGYYHTRGYIDHDDADYIYRAMLAAAGEPE